MVTVKLNNLCGRRFVDHGGGACKTLSIKKNGGFYESYTGKYGAGVIYHQPNSEYSGPRYSNNYHKIFYYLIVK